jgi:L-rhamnose isomerase
MDSISLYNSAKEKYAEFGINTDEAIDILGKTSISLQCWQGDDVTGFERPDSTLTGSGLQVTGNYPGKAQNIAELRRDLEKTFSLIPGNHRLNLHSIYGDFCGKNVERNKFNSEHFESWISWAQDFRTPLDFNSTCFSHPMASSGFTLSSKDEKIRNFWIEHVDQCRQIASYIGLSLNDTCIHNIWIPDGYKDLPADRMSHRKLLMKSLDTIFSVDYSPDHFRDSLESKLFGIGSEAYVVGSHEFYMGYALKNNKMICLDMGHFHPTESIADKISSILLFSPELLLHISRGVRWDSDHVVIMNDDLKETMTEIVRGNLLDRVHLALDFFDGSINRTGAWIIGTRAVQKSLLYALLEPHKKLVEYEEEGNFFARLALLEEIKTLPFGQVWEYFCEKNNKPNGDKLINEIMKYEKNVLSKRK